MTVAVTFCFLDKAENLCAAEEISRDHRVDDPGNSCSDSPTADTEPLTGKS
jgi:hypothetical protein